MNYGELQDAIKSYLYDRTDLVAVIPTFIQLAERRIYRMLRVPANETIVRFPAHASGSINLPTDFLEAKILTVGKVPMKRISDLEHLRKQDRRGASGPPREFSRIGAQLHLYPTPDEAVDVALVYWRDMSGSLVQTTDTNEVLRIAADVYLHGALMEASAYLGQDSRIPVWQARYQEELAQIQQQAAEAEYAGSVTTVNNAYPDYGSTY